MKVLLIIVCCTLPLHTIDSCSAKRIDFLYKLLGDYEPPIKPTLPKRECLGYEPLFRGIVLSVGRCKKECLNEPTCFVYNVRRHGNELICEVFDSSTGPIENIFSDCYKPDD